MNPMGQHSPVVMEVDTAIRRNVDAIDVTVSGEVGVELGRIPGNAPESNRNEAWRVLGCVVAFQVVAIKNGRVV